VADGACGQGQEQGLGIGGEGDGPGPVRGGEGGLEMVLREVVEKREWIGGAGGRGKLICLSCCNDPA
jgi:hypothetical protein